MAGPLKLNEPSNLQHKPQITTPQQGQATHDTPEVNDELAASEDNNSGDEESMTGKRL